MNTLVLTSLAAFAPLLAAPPEPAASAGSWSAAAEVPGLAARCLWAERGWSSAALAFAEGADASAVRFAREDLEEHSRLHGWVGEAGDGSSFLVTARAQCPPAALVELTRFAPVRLSEEQVEAFAMLARAFAENGHVERAVALLAELRADTAIDPNLLSAGQLRDRSAWQAARLLEQAGRYDAALDGFDALQATERWDELAIDRCRAHCLAELDRVAELESLVFANLMSDPSCELLEHLLDAWERAGSTKGLEQLLAACDSAVLDPFAKARLQATIAFRFRTAWRHRRILAMRPELALEELPHLLDTGGHQREIQASLRAIGPSAVAYLQRYADDLPADQPRLNHELYAVLAETGLPELESVIARLDERSPGFPYIEVWRAARDLREQLPLDRGQRR